MNGLVRLARESAATALSRPVSTIVVILMFAVVSFAVLVTTGSAAGSVATTIAAVDSAAPRSIIIRSEPGHGLTADVVARLARIDRIESVTAFGAPEDARNAALPRGALVAVLPMWSSAGAGPRAEGVLVSPRAAATLGLLTPSGLLRTSSGAVLTVAGAVDPPAEWEMLEPLAVRPFDEFGDVGPVATVVIVADRVASVPAVVDLVRALVDSGAAPADIRASRALVDLRARVESQVTGFAHTVTVGVLCTAVGLVSGLLTVVAVLLRRDTARRRALGATRLTVAALVVLQAAGCAMLGHTIGVITATVGLAVWGNPQPPADVIVAVGFVSAAAAIVSALGPVLIAVTRDPARELRVP